MDQIRDAIREKMQAAGVSKRALSLKIKKGATYIHDYLDEGSPRELPHEVKVMVAGILNMQLAELGISPLAHDTKQMPAGFADDGESYQPPRNHYLAASPHIGYFRMRSHALDQHPDRIVPGNILAFDINRVHVPDIPPLAIVVVQLFDRVEGLKTHGTIIRQFVPPNKLVTNSSQANDMISLDDPALPYIAQIRGTMLAVVREMN